MRRSHGFPRILSDNIEQARPFAPRSSSRRDGVPRDGCPPIGARSILVTHSPGMPEIDGMRGRSAATVLFKTRIET